MCAQVPVPEHSELLDAVEARLLAYRFPVELPGVDRSTLERCPQWQAVKRANPGSAALPHCPPRHTAPAAALPPTRRFSAAVRPIARVGRRVRCFSHWRELGEH